MEQPRVSRLICQSGILLLCLWTAMALWSQTPSPAGGKDNQGRWLEVMNPGDAATEDAGSREVPADEKLDPANPADLKLMVFPARSIDELSGGADSNPTLNASLTTVLNNQAILTPFTLVHSPDWATLSSDQAASDDHSDIVLATARKAGVQATLSLFWFQEGRRITLIAKIYDVWSQRMVAGSTLTGLDDLSLLNTTDTLLSGLISQLVAESSQIISEWGSAGPATMSRELILRCPAEGASVYLVGGGLLGTISEGKITLPFRPLAVNKGIQLRIEKPGYYTSTVTLEVKGTRPELELPDLYPMSSFTALVSVNTDMFSGPSNEDSSTRQSWLKWGAGLGFRWFPIADTWFVQGNYLMNQVNNRTDPNNEFTKPFFLHQLSFETALVMLTPPDWIFRVYAGLGLGSFFSGSPSQTDAIFLDPFIELPYLNAQLNLHPFTLEVEMGALFVFDSSINLLPTGLVKYLGPTRISVGWKW